MNELLQSARRFRWWHELIIAALLAGLLAAAGQLIPAFLKLNSQLLLSRQLWEFAILAPGMTLIIITGGIDLSIGSTMGLCAVAFGMSHAASGHVVVATVVCIATGLLCGAMNGLLIARFRLHALIVTLATFAAYRGIAEGISQGQSYSQFGPAFSRLARGTWLGLPWPGYLFLLLAVLATIFLTRMPTGRFLYAIGHNERAAVFSGVPVDRIKFWLYTISGLLASVATIIYLARFDTAKADAGKGFELDVITAVVLGGTSIYGGRGTIVGTTLGLLLIHETRLFVTRYWKTDELRSVVIGMMLIVAILIYQLFAGSRRR